MSKKLLWTLVVLAVTILVLLFNMRGDVSVSLLPNYHLEMVRAIAFLVFVGVGVTIGLLLK